MQLSPRSRPSSTSLLSGFVSLRYALDWGSLPFFLDLPDMRCQLIPARRLAGLSDRRAQVPPSICTCTADFRNRSNESVIELANSHMTQFTWVFVMDCVRAIIALTWGSWGYGPAERWHLLPRPNYLIRIMPA